MKNSELILNQVDKSDQYQTRQAEFEAFSMELAESELELATLENELSIFEIRYARAVGILFAELDFLDKEIARELYQLHPEEKYRQAFQEAERKAQASQEAVNEKTNQDEKKPYIPSEEIKTLYRKVAKTVHPDFAVNEAERAFRTELMARANEAYKNGDKQALEQILYEWDHRDENFFSQEENQLELKLTQIKARLKQIEERIKEIKKSDLYQLMLKVERADRDGRDLLGEMAKDLQGRIREAKKLLDSLKLQENG